MSGFDVEYQVTFQCGDRVEPVVFGARVKRDPIGTRAYEIIIDQLRRTIGARVYAGVMEMVDRGEPVRLGGLVLSPQGFAQEDKGDEVQPWTTYAGVEVTGHHAPFIEIFRVRDDGKRKRACRVMVDATAQHRFGAQPVPQLKVQVRACFLTIRGTLPSRRTIHRNFCFEFGHTHRLS
jgi:hypothetical protein